MPRVAHCLLAAGLALSLAGCGNKGALVLPDQQPKKQKKTQSAAPATPAPKSGEAKPDEPPAGGTDASR